MNNPIKLMMRANLNAMVQYMQFSQSMLAAFFPVQGQSQQPKPALVPATVPVKRRGCIGPADLRS